LLALAMHEILCPGANFDRRDFGSRDQRFGALVANAAVKGTNEATGQAWAAASGSSGEFQLQKLRPGFYSLEVSAPGFQVFAQIKSASCGAGGSTYPSSLVGKSRARS